MKVIAEIGCNFKDMTEAKEMIKKCHEVGVDLVKFQLFSRRYALDNKIPVYLSLEFDQAKELFDYGKSIGQEVFFTPFDVERVSWCKDIGVKYIKVRFADRFNKGLINTVIKTKIPWFLSVRVAISDYSEPELLYCVPNYPATIWNYLENIPTFESYSDHTPDLRLMKILKTIDKDNNLFNYVEKHVKLREDCLESKWSVFIEDLGEVIGKVPDALFETTGLTLGDDHFL